MLNPASGWWGQSGEVSGGDSSHRSDFRSRCPGGDGRGRRGGWGSALVGRFAPLLLCNRVSPMELTDFSFLPAVPPISFSPIFFVSNWMELVCHFPKSNQGASSEFRRTLPKLRICWRGLNTAHDFVSLSWVSHCRRIMVSPRMGSVVVS